ncbi:MAG TPA: hypothetical protein ENN11_00695 [Methanomicrobia archaeon]|nr:hypothetical protein [Methanomicrobia archaeon]
MSSRYLRPFLVIALLSLFVAAAPLSAAPITKSSGQVELELDVPRTLISDAQYTYAATLLKLESCDEVLSSDFTCIPSFSVRIDVIDRTSDEIVASTTLEHIKYGKNSESISVVDENIVRHALEDVASFELLTFVSFKVVNFGFDSGTAQVEVSYYENTPAEEKLTVSGGEDKANATVGIRETLTYTITNPNPADRTLMCTISNDEPLSNLSLNDKNVEIDEPFTFTVMPGENEVTLSFVPEEEGHQTLSLTLAHNEERYVKETPMLVHPYEEEDISIVNAERTPFDEAIRNDQLLSDMRMDSLYMVGLSFVLLVFGGVLGFIHSANNGTSSRKKQHE